MASTKGSSRLSANVCSWTSIPRVPSRNYAPPWRCIYCTSIGRARVVATVVEPHGLPGVALDASTKPWTRQRPTSAPLLCCCSVGWLTHLIRAFPQASSAVQSLHTLKQRESLPSACNPYPSHTELPTRVASAAPVRVCTATNSLHSAATRR